MTKNLILAALGILLTGLIGCEIKTPEIQGVVLDAETNQPVEGAWVTSESDSCSVGRVGGTWPGPTSAQRWPYTKRWV